MLVKETCDKICNTIKTLKKKEILKGIIQLYIMSRYISQESVPCVICSSATLYLSVVIIGFPVAS